MALDANDVALKRLNYIGSKYQLIDWLFDNILEKTGFNSFENVSVGDLFSGTGIVSYRLRKLGAKTITSDAELYSAVIAGAMARSTYTDFVHDHIHTLNKELESGAHKDTVGFITRNYSPFDGQTRMFFTVENAKRIDYLRARIAALSCDYTEDENDMMLSSLLVSADRVANVPAVYGCYLKNFKAKSIKNLVLEPIHTDSTPAHPESLVECADILSQAFLAKHTYDVVYLDPPYNNRQYSKNYFPLNMIASKPEDIEHTIINGVSGIPEGCFVSPLCQKRKAAQAFEDIISTIDAKWIFISYNSESIVQKDDMLVLLARHGTASVIERDYKRFKSFSYNEDKDIVEYLFCLQKK